VRGINWSHPLARGLVYDAYFPGSGTKVVDRTGNSADLTLAGAADWDTGSLGSALKLSGADGDYAGLASGGVSLPVGASDDFTLEMAVELTSAGDLSHVFGFGPNPNIAPSNGTRRQVLSFGQIYFWGESSDLGSGVGFATDGSLQYVIITRKKIVSPASDTIAFYRNGSLIASGSTPSLATAADGIWIGSHHPAVSYTVAGKVSIARVRNVALTSSEVSDLNPDPFAFLAKPGGANYYHRLLNP
jgi:hypothetical protein